MEDFGPFGLGPWSVEPDFAEWVDKATGYTCQVRRHPSLGHLCGYVEIPAEIQVSDETDLFVHGGVTYNAVDAATQMRRVGFDCAHAGDLTPATQRFRKTFTVDDVVYDPEDVYRPFSYVKEQCERLAKQLRALADAGR